MVTRNNGQLATCTLPVVMIKITFPLLALVRYILPFTPVYSLDNVQRYTVVSSLRPQVGHFNPPRDPLGSSGELLTHHERSESISPHC